MNECYLARNPRTAWRIYDGEAVILLSEDSTLNSLNAVGTLIWETADGVTSLDTIVARICDEFDVEPAQARADAAAFVDKLCRRGLLSMTASPQSRA